MDYNNFPVTIPLEDPEEIKDLPSRYKVVKMEHGDVKSYHAVRPLTSEEMTMVFKGHNQRVLW